MNVRSDITEAVRDLKEERARIRTILKEVRQFDDRVAVGAQVDLMHADTSLDRAISMLNRLLVNGVMPWDKEDAHGSG